MATLEFTVTIEVGNEAAFRLAAHQRLIEQGVEEEEAAGYIDAAVTSIDTCAMVLLDPGDSPAGSSILWSDARKLHS